MSVLKLIFLLLSVKIVKSARILGAVFSPSYSHQIVFHPIWTALALKGHHVTLLTTDPIRNASLKSLHEIDLSQSYAVMEEHNASLLLTSKEMSPLDCFTGYIKALSSTADWQLSHPEVRHLIQNKTEFFDLLMVEVVFPTQMAFAVRFKVPFIGLASLNPPARIHTAMGNPTHPLLYPDNLPFSKIASLKHKIASFLLFWVMRWYSNYRLYPREDLTVRKHFGVNYPPLGQIQKNMSLLFVNSNPVLHRSRPLLPNTILIGGGIHLKPPENLDNYRDIKQFLDGATEGFLYFSLGTNVKSAQLNHRLKRVFLETFSEIPFKVLWKFERDLPNLPGNVKIVKWAPQQAILRHVHIRAFLTQCGLQSLEEAIYSHVPLIALPFFGDQFQNAQILEDKHIGINLDSETLTKEQLKSAILAVVQQNYRNNVKELAELCRDQVMGAVNRAVWWTEYVIRHKGAPYFRNADIQWWEYLCLDVVGVLIVAGVLLVYIFVATCKYFKAVFRYFWMLGSSKVKRL